MGFFSSLGSFFKKLWNALKKALKWIMDHLLIVLAICAIIFIAFAPLILPLLAAFAAPAWLVSFVAVAAAWGWTVCLLVGFGLAYLMAPEFTGEVIGKIGEAVSGVAGAAGEAIGDIGGSFIGGLFESPVGIGILVIGGVLIFNKLAGKKQGSPPPKPKVQKTSVRGIARA